MTRRLSPWLATFGLLSLSSSAFAADAAAIKSAVRLPSMQINAGIGYSPRSGLVQVDESGTPEAAIARLRAGLKGDAGDAASYRTLGNIYAAHAQPEEARRAYTKAIELYEAALKTQPDEGFLLSGKGSAMAGLGDLEAAEKYLKTHSTRLPKAWQVRTALGRVLQQRALTSFWPLGTTSVPDLFLQISQQGQEFPVLAAVRLKAKFPSTAQLKTASELLDESYAAFDAAIKSAPNEPEVYAERISHRFSGGPVALAIGELQKLDSKASLMAIEEALKGLMNTGNTAMLDPEHLADARKVAELRRDDPQAWGLAAGMGRFITGFLDNAGKGANGELRKALAERFKALDGLSEKAQSELERLGNVPNPKDAAAALEALGLTQYQVGNPKAAESSLRKAVSLDPMRAQPWEMLAAILLSNGKFADVGELYEGHLKHRDTTRARLMLAKVYERLDKPAMLEAHLDEALKLDSSDPSARIYNAAYALRKRGADGIPAAENHLREAEKGLERKPARVESLNVKYVRAVILALQSKTDASRKLLAEVLKEDEQHAGALALNTALGR